MDELLVFFFIVSGAVLFIWMVAAINKNHQETIDKTWKGVASDLNGRFNGRSWGKHRAIDYEAEGHKAKLTIHVVGGGDSSAIYTQVTFRLKKVPFRVNIYPEAFYHGLSKMLGSQDIEIGHASFDASYMIKGTHPKRIKRFLTPECRSAIRKSQGHGWGATINVFTTNGTLVVRRLGQLKNRTQLRNFANTCNVIFRNYLNAGDFEGKIEFFNEVIQTEGDCPICATGLTATSQVVGCSRCHTPHHKDCWRFFGSCAVYGCGCTQFKYVKTKKVRSTR